MVEMAMTPSTCSQTDKRLWSWPPPLPFHKRKMGASQKKMGCGHGHQLTLSQKKEVRVGMTKALMVATTSLSEEEAEGSSPEEDRVWS